MKYAVIDTSRPAAFALVVEVREDRSHKNGDDLGAWDCSTEEKRRNEACRIAGIMWREADPKAARFVDARRFVVAAIEN